MDDKTTRPVPKPDFLTQEQWDQVMQGNTRAGQKASSEKDVEIYLRTQGRGDGVFELMGMAPHTLVLTAIGRRSGKELNTALIYIRDGDDVIVVGSSGGLPEHPNWWLNLQKNPRAWVQIGAQRWAVRAREANAEERARLWPKVVEVLPLWDHFQKYCDREFPVVILSRDSRA